MTDTSLYGRKALPADLRYLVEKYPRESWGAKHTIGQMGRFWLERHDMFRELGAGLVSATVDLREERLTPQQFASWFAPRLNFFLSQLHGHHQIEDQHYFPVFAAAEARLKRGFDILDADHHVIHDLLEANAASANEFLGALQKGGDPLKRATDAYGGHAEHLLTGLLRHLDDEEDLIIPLLLDRGEASLGVS
jgi:hemerythrin-like domain-containing protein